MADFQTAHKKTMGYEGGYSNNPGSDHGGETYKGISRVYWPAWQGWRTIDQVKSQITAQPLYDTNSYFLWVRFLDKTLADNASLQHQVLNFYEANFWNPDQLGYVNDQNVANWLYNHAVNAGGRGVMWMQEAAGVAVDGVVGAKTLAAINTCDPVALIEKAKVIAIKYRLAKVAADPSQRQFLHSWLIRDGLTEEQAQTILTQSHEDTKETLKPP